MNKENSPALLIILTVYLLNECGFLMMKHEVYVHPPVPARTLQSQNPQCSAGLHTSLKQVLSSLVHISPAPTTLFIW